MALYLCDTNYNTRGSIEQFKIFMMLLLVFLIKKNSWNYQSSPLKMTNDKRPIINWIKTKKYSLFVCVFDSILPYQQQWRWQMLSLSILFPCNFFEFTKKLKLTFWVFFGLSQCISSSLPWSTLAESFYTNAPSLAAGYPSEP